MKKKIIIILSIILFIIISIFITKIVKNKIYENKIKNAILDVKLREDLSVKFNEKIKISDLIENLNGNIINDKYINTTKIGKKKIKFEFINEENLKIPYEFEVSIIDDIPPVVWLSGNKTVTVNSDDTLLDDIMCADNYDSKPKCEIIGDYDLNSVGKYDLKFVATDSSNNVTLKEFSLNVKEKSKKKSTSGDTVTLFSDVIKNYKSDNVKVGLDLSSWQGDVDFEKIKEAGVEFLILRVGSTKGRNAEYFVDSHFDEYVKSANNLNIPVGVYFYSYSTNGKDAKENAKWVIDKIKNYNVDLEIAFDWENWSNYNAYQISFYELTEMANIFIKEIEASGYKGMLYGSKNYLEQIYLSNDNTIWLAHYTSKTNYQGKYKYWQLCNDGRIDGINGAVDIDLMFTY